MNEIQTKAFWSKVAISDNAHECWNWLGAKKPKGYGNVRINGRYRLAHRVAFEAAVGNIPENMQVCHICDNPACCNPGHLMLGTARSNYCDMLIKNRQDFYKNRATGERNTNSKLTDEDVRQIRNAYSLKKLNQYELAEKYGVSQPCIGSIIQNKTWRHI